MALFGDKTVITLLSQQRESLLGNLNVLLAANGQKSIKDMVSGAEIQVKTMNDQTMLLETQANQAAQAAYETVVSAAQEVLATENEKVSRTRATANSQRTQAQGIAAAAAALK